MKEHLERDVPYFPCLALRFNTTVEHSCEASAAVCKMFEILQDLFVFFTSSTKRHGVLQNVRESEYGTTLELRNLSATHWSTGANSQVLMESFKPLRSWKIQMMRKPGERLRLFSRGSSLSNLL